MNIEKPYPDWKSYEVDCDDGTQGDVIYEPVREDNRVLLKRIENEY